MDIKKIVGNYWILAWIWERVRNEYLCGG